MRIILLSFLTTKFFVLEYIEANILHISSESSNPVDVFNTQLIITKIYFLQVSDNEGYRGKNMSYTLNSIYLRAYKMKIQITTGKNNTQDEDVK
jgi:hypothetical protein